MTKKSKKLPSLPDSYEEYKIEQYLNQIAHDYKPVKSDDPMENECATCTFTEQAHKDPRMKQIGCCDTFKQVK